MESYTTKGGIPGLSGMYTPTHQLPEGMKLDNFIIERVLGFGGFGITYQATDISLQRKVVLKENFPRGTAYRHEQTMFLYPNDPESREDYEWSLSNFLREARMLAALDHPFIVKVLSTFEELGTAYFVMPFVDGYSLGNLISRREGKGQVFNEEEVLGLLTRLLDALQYIHRKNIFHRDIKPDNVLISREGLPILIDFGSARHLDNSAPKTIIETHGYSPPEQSFSVGNHGPWSDLYSLGALVHKMLVGRPPAAGPQRAIRDPNPPLSQRPELEKYYDPVLLRTVDKALIPDTGMRYASAEEWLQELWPILPKA